MIDTHTHLNFSAFENDWRDMVSRANESGVEKMIVVGTDLETSKRAISMAEEVESLYVSVGIHPHHAKKYLLDGEAYPSDLKKLESLISHPKVVAVGEIGLDNHDYKNSKKYKTTQMSDELVDMQADMFDTQVRMATKHRKPVIVHSREARDKVLSYLLSIENEEDKKIKGVFHCFEGSKKYAKKILASGYFISFTGNITYDAGRAETSKIIPLDRLLLETDCPYMTPNPKRFNRKEGEKPLRCEPEDVKITAKYHAKLRDTTFEEVVNATTSNANTLFGI